MTQIEKDGILSTVLDVPTKLKEVRLKPKNKLYALLEKAGVKKPVYQSLVLRNLKMSTNYRLTAISNAMEKESPHEGSVDSIMYLLQMNTYSMAAYVATAIQNENKPAPKYLIQTIADEFTNEELKLAVKEVYRRLDVQSFFESSALIQSLELM